MSADVPVKSSTFADVRVKSSTPADVAIKSSTPADVKVKTSTPADVRVKSSTPADDQQQKQTECHDQESRLKKVNDVCVITPIGYAWRIISDVEHRLSNCIVPKVGCTFWINIFRFLNNETSGVIYDSPFDIPRMTTHYGNISFEESMWSSQPASSFMADSLRFITNTSFMENPEQLNEHWAPYKYVCDPCLFRPHILGKMETFTRDSRLILEKANMTWLLDEPINRKVNVTHSVTADRAIKEMEMLTEYNVEMWNFFQEEFETCFTLEQLFSRLWTAFQFNGHLPMEVPFPPRRPREPPLTQESFIQLCTHAYKAWSSRDSKTQKAQKRAAMLRGYMEVPTDLLYKIEELYRWDFIMFDYNRYPRDIYENR
ncbi:uncharacterized protein LOC131957462 [Physella acuta]|uniref:uncharacterized protein LOC131957462 n=1 Tax=Physella acuta TaxID=109671 RepID=UPI0027DD8BDE|nr:uncharacterized protein LOC131957462 [Physella acuta]